MLFLEICIVDFFSAKTNEKTFYLNSVAPNFDINNPAKIDKSAFSMRKMAKKRAFERAKKSDFSPDGSGKTSWRSR